jgi:ABC-type transporter Mla MlaB component
MILAPIFRKHREADAEQDATDDSRALVGYHPVFVFDESQTARRRYCSDWNRQRRSGFKPMLRITETDVAVDGAKLRLDGKLAGPWVCELKLRCEPILAKSERIQMDRGGVSSIDSDGIALMQILQAKGVTLVNCSPFIKLQLGQR